MAEAALSGDTTQTKDVSDAFEPLKDIDTQEQTQWSFMALPNRFFQFWRAVRSIVLWWKDEQDLPETQETPLLIGEPEDIEQDKRDRPQMYSDQASINRSLLDR